MKTSKNMYGYVAIGIGVGTAFGVAMDNLAVGVAFGAALGIVISSINQRRQNKSSQG